MAATLTALRRNRAARNRHQAAGARHDMRTWQVERRKRTRHLIELAAFIWMADKLRSNDGQRARDLWAGKGKVAFDAEGNAYAQTITARHAL